MNTDERDPKPGFPGGDEAGLTLLELLVTVVLMGIVMCGVGTALYQALQIPAEGQARSIAANARTYATTIMSDDIANTIEIETPDAEQSEDPLTPNAYVVDSDCSTTTTEDDLFRLTWSDTTVVEYRLQYSTDQPGFSVVALQRSEDGGDWTTVVAGYCKGTEGVLDVLTITSGADGAKDPLTNETPWYASRRLRAQFHFRDTRSDMPTLVDIEAAPRTDCRPGTETPGPLDVRRDLPTCEHVDS